MDKQTLINKLNQADLPGVGAVVKYADGCKDYFFYEDFSSNDLGINRAEKTYTDLINAGKVKRVDYIYKGSAKIWFWDWNSKPGTFCANDEYIRFNKAHGIDYYYQYPGCLLAIIGGTRYKYDYTPAIDGISAITAVRYKEG